MQKNATIRMQIVQPILIILMLMWSVLAYAQDHPKVPYGPETRQFLDIYIAPSECPTPVYFDAHGNGGTTNMPNSTVEALKAAGISIVAWESLTSVNTPGQVETGWTDAELMFAWVKEHAETYNFDTTNFIIGGSSRGSILSWKYGHRPNPDIKGLYMYNALPNGTWADSTWWYPPNEVTVESPPIFFVYRFEPGVTFDSHDPKNGLIITDKYESLGIGDRDTLIHSIEYSDNQDKYQFLVPFIRSVIQPCQTVSAKDFNQKKTAFIPFPNPFQNELSIMGLKGGEHITLRNANGASILEADHINRINTTALNPGLYLLTIQTKDHSSIHRLIKQ